jgi:5-methylcytosine-specific restriction endonuclease McrA
MLSLSGIIRTNNLLVNVPALFVPAGNVTETYQEASMFGILTRKKKCGRCGEVKPFKEFHKDKSKKDGVHTICVACNRVSDKEYYTKNKETIKAKAKLWSDANPERKKQNDKRHYEANKERVKAVNHLWRMTHRAQSNASRAAWARNHPEYTRERHKKYEKEHPEWMREKWRNRQAREKGAPGKITRREWEDLKKKYDYTCLRCKKQEPEIVLTIDHVKPLVLGGTNTIDNAQPLCGVCNSRKNAKEIDYR